MFSFIGLGVQVYMCYHNTSGCTAIHVRKTSALMSWIHCHVRKQSTTLFRGDTGTVEGKVFSTLFYLLFDRSGSYSPLSAGVSGVFPAVNCFEFILCSSFKHPGCDGRSCTRVLSFLEYFVLSVGSQIRLVLSPFHGSLSGG